MKKKPKSLFKTVGVCAGAAAVSALLSGCSWFIHETVYGPPPMPSDPEVDPGLVETVYGPPPDWQTGYVPDDNIPEDVYGPPMIRDDEYDPEKDVPEPVYGPPANDFGAPVTPQPEGTQP